MSPIERRLQDEARRRFKKGLGASYDVVAGAKILAARIRERARGAA